MKNKSFRLIAFIILSLCFLSAITPDSVMAQSKISLSETELVFSGLVGETLQRTVTLTVAGDPIAGMQVIIPDLIDPTTKSAILSDRIAVSPSDLNGMSGSQVITFSLTGLDRFGTFEGDVRFVYPEQDTEQTIRLHLKVELHAVPAVDADVNSKNLNLFVEPSLLDLPFGRPAADASSPLLGEVVLSMIQSGDSPARISNARVLAMQSTQGRTLPDEAVSVTTKFPLDLSAKDAATISVMARGRNLPAGEYSGTLLVNIDNQPGPVQIPLKVQVKDGPILPFVLLAAGPLVGILFLYWNKNGKTLLEAQQRIQRLQRVLRTGRLLTIQDQEQAKIKLESIMDAILNQTDSTEITTLLQDIEAFVKAQQANGEQYLVSLQTQQGRLESLTLGNMVKDKMTQSLQELRDRIEKGSAASWEAVQKQLDAAQQSIDEMEQVIEQFKLLPSDKQAILQPRLEKARNLDEMKAILDEGRSIIPKEIKDFLTGAQPGERPEWTRFNLVLQWRRLAVAAVIYIFTLFVGWITLYASSPTFGSNREDYITLFLWGVASNAIGGQSLDLKSIMTRQGDSTPT